MDSFWPLFGIRLRHRDVLLRPMREADLAPLAAMLPGDVGHDPRLAMFESQTFEENERRLFCQGYWRSMGNWDPAAWELHFVVFYDGEPVGVQTLEGTDFPRLRTVDTASWLIPPVRGRGIGVMMRTAVLGLAFDHLGAVAAISSATLGNAGSLGVSRRIGYAENGRSRIVDTSGEVVELQNFLLTADRRPAAEVSVTGLEAALPWFGR
jgi:RimJ/RimL family protein N-acetyltransferase